jgi:hypothetical protein
MKTITMILALSFGIYSANASDTTSTADNKEPKKSEAVKQALDRELNQHIFFPSSAGDEMGGSADVTFEIMPEGYVKVVSIQSENELVENFIVRQVGKMKINITDEMVGEVFKYRFIFRRQA